MMPVVLLSSVLAPTTTVSPETATEMPLAEARSRVTVQFAL